MDPYRFLGFAFASADLLFEIDPAGGIVFAVGAAQGLAGRPEGELVGLSWRDLIAADDQAMVEAMFVGLENGRAGPLTVALSGTSDSPHFVALSACRLPPQKNISCAVTLSAPTPLAARASVDAAGYQDRTDFEALAKTVLAAAATVGQELDLALIDLPGLTATMDRLGPRQAAALLRRFAGALRAEAYGGAPPARLGEERFAVIRQRPVGRDRLHDRLSATLTAEGAGTAPAANAQVLAIEGGAGSVDRSLRAIRYAIEAFAEGGAPGLAGASMNEAFTRSVQRTLAEAGEFGEVIKARKFNLVFQPIVSLANGACEHFETLVRFQDDTSPFKLIRMAEELDLILELDLAMVEQALGRLRGSALKLAVNISGSSIMDPWFITQIRRMTAEYGVEPARLVFEITESVAIDNLALADRHIQQLRGDGHLICLDDFGAGAASYPYLQKLHVDIVKIDGRYVQELAKDGRDAALVRHLVGLCHELGVLTVAEKVTSAQVEAIAKAAGVDYGQGYFYAQPTAEPTFAPRQQINLKRHGVREQWG